MQSGGHVVFLGDTSGFGVSTMNALFGYSVVSTGLCASPLTASAATNTATLNASVAAGTPFETVCDCSKLFLCVSDVVPPHTHTLALRSCAQAHAFTSVA